MSFEMKTIEHDPNFTQTFEYIAELKSEVEKHFVDSDKKKIEEAIDLCVELHHDQPREEGGPYVNHPLRVALKLLKEFEVRDRDSVIAALLHDSIEDQPEKLAKGIEAERITIRTLALEKLTEQFGEEVAQLVAGLTNSDRIDYFTRVKDAIADPKVALIKLCDFFDNAKVNPSARPVPEKHLEKYIRASGIYTERFSAEDMKELQKFKILEKIQTVRQEMENLLTV